MMMYCFSSWPLIISNFNLQPIKYISQIDIPAELFHYEILQLFLRRSFMGENGSVFGSIYLETYCRKSKFSDITDFLANSI